MQSTPGVIPQEIKDLIQEGESLFSDRMPLLSLWQEQAENFYVERADFTVQRSIGRDFAAFLTTSYPLMVRRDLGNIFQTMLRPKDKEWFGVTTMREDKQDDAAKKWLEMATNTQRAAIYCPDAQFERATGQADNDYATFGNAVISIEMNRNFDSLLFRNWHLRDVAWACDYDGTVNRVHRKWKPTRRELVQHFKDKVSPKITEQLSTKGFERVHCRHIVVPSDTWNSPSGKKFRTKYVSIHIDVDNQHIMEETGQRQLGYVIPRWALVSGSQYAYSPCTICALPDARLIQSMTLVLLEVGERAADPPRVAPADVLRSDVNTFPGGVTTYDSEYDEKSGEVLRSLMPPTQGLTFAGELRNDVKESINNAFYLNKISLPPIGRDMTAFEVGQRVSEYVRNALPLFAPMETEYNAALCEMSFDMLLQGGAFGSPHDIPKSIRGADIQFKFESPLHSALSAQKATQFDNARAMIAETMGLYPAAANLIDPKVALKDALEGAGTPKSWFTTAAQQKQMEAKQGQQQNTQQTLANLGQGADVATKIGAAQQSLAGVPARASAKVQPQL